MKILDRIYDKIPLIFRFLLVVMIAYFITKTLIYEKSVHIPQINVALSSTPKVDGWKCKDYLQISSEMNSLYVFGASKSEVSKALITVGSEQLPLAIRMQDAIYKQKSNGIKPILDLLTKVCE